MTFQPFIFVDTNFKRDSQPIFALAFMENHRRIQVPEEIATVEMVKQIPKIRSIIQQHYEQTGGELDLWGTIQCYKYLYAENQSIIFDTAGIVLDVADDPDPVQPAATITLNGGDLTTVIKMGQKSH